MNAREGSKRVDKVLVSDTFADKDSVSAIVRNHILHSPSGDGDHKSEPHDQIGGDKHIDAVTGYWTEKVWKFLEELRSASLTNTSKLVASHETSRDWNVKDETDRFRVMYREGPVGTPFHTLCLDGLVDGDVSSGMCVAWESPMFKEWWPQFIVPTFKIVESKWIRRVRVGEDVSIMRFKVPWPLAPREVIMSSFELEFFEEDLIIGLIDSVPEAVEINEKLRGYSAADLPAPSSDVRMEIAGGFIMQRISNDQFFFRTIMNLDMKLELVPPWVINFMSRQLAGQGLKLYQKAVLAVAHGTGNGKAFQKLLQTEQLYQRIRSGLENKTADTGQLPLSPIGRLPTYKDSVKSKTLQGSIRRMGNSENNRIVPYPVKGDETETVLEGRDAILAVEPSQPQFSSAPLVHTPPVDERNSAEEISLETASSSNQVDSSKTEVIQNGHERREYNDPEVEWAVTILDKMISFTRACAAQRSSAATENLARKVESTSGLESKLDLNEEKHDDKPTVPSAKGQYSHILVHRQVKEEKLDNQNTGRSSVGARPESCRASGFLSTSEIEIVESQDDADSHPVKIGLSVDSKPEVEELEVVERKGKSRKWHWACFSPRNMRRNRNRRANLFRDGSVDVKNFERGSRRHGRVLRENSSRFVKERDYVTDVEAITGRYKLENRASNAQRTSTLGELLMEAPK